MRALPLTLLFLFGLAGAAAAQDAATAPNTPPPAKGPDVVVRQSADPAKGAVIGQRVALLVDVMFRNGMPRPPRVALPDAPGLQVFRFETQGTTLRESIAGESYTGQRFEFALYARRGGAFEIPPAKITLLDAKGDVTGAAKGQPVRLEVSVPPGVDPSQPVVATSTLTLHEEWLPQPAGDFKTGDAIVRTITRTAEDVPGLAMRDLVFRAPAGARVYVDPPEVDDRSNRGVVTGQRVDRVTYVFEQGGRFELPALSQPWWDLGAGTSRTADAKGATIDVAAQAPSSETAGRGAPPAPILAAAGGAVILLLTFASRYLSPRSGPSDEDAEREAFDAISRACSGGNAEAIYRAFSAWRDTLQPADRGKANEIAAPLDAALFAENGSTWNAGDSRELILGLEHVRRIHPAIKQSEALPPLNP